MLVWILAAVLIAAIWMSKRRKEGMEQLSYTKMVNTGFESPTFMSLMDPKKTANDCMTACDAEPDCAGFTFLPKQGCELKSSMQLNQSGSAPMFDSYIKKKETVPSQSLLQKYAPSFVKPLELPPTTGPSSTSGPPAATAATAATAAAATPTNLPIAQQMPSSLIGSAVNHAAMQGAAVAHDAAMVTANGTRIKAANEW